MIKTYFNGMPYIAPSNPYTSEEMERINKLLRMSKDKWSLEDKVFMIDYDIRISLGYKISELEYENNCLRCSIGALKSQLQKMEDKIFFLENGITRSRRVRDSKDIKTHSNFTKL